MVCAALSLGDMACSSSLPPLASFACWRGRSTAGPSHYRSYRKASLTLDDVGCNDPLSDPEHIRVVRIDADLDPMMVGGAESL